MKIHCLYLVLCGSLLTGCATGRHQREAAALADKVKNYQDNQQIRIERLNREYQAEHKRLMRELERLLDDQFSGENEADAQRAADGMAAKWEERTQPRIFSQQVENEVATQLTRLDELDRQLSQTRKAYADSYRNLQLHLKNLEDLHARLAALAVKPGHDKELVRVLRELYDAYQKLQTQTKAAPAQPTS